MKLIKYSNKITVTICAITVLFLGSCQDLDEGSRGAVSGDSYYKDAQSLSSGVTGIYGTLQKVVWGLDQLAFYTGADDLTTHNGGNKWVFAQGDQFAMTGINSRTINVYNLAYKCINNANYFIEKANPEGVDETIINNAHANARFVRALLYFRLTMCFGDIPMPLTSTPDFNIKKTSQREVIQQVIEDLEFAAKWAINDRDYTATEKDGHVSKTAAKAFLAKAHMQLTGYPFNEPENWTAVKNYTDNIINEGVYSLLDNYAHNFGSEWDNNKESIWAHQFSRAAWPINTDCRWYGSFWNSWMDMFIEWKFYDNFDDGYRKSFCLDTTSQDSKAYNHPVLTKLLYATIPGKPEFVHAWQTNNDVPAMRYAEVLLMNAEANAIIGSPNDAIEALNKVRRRAFAKGVSTSEEVDALGANFWEVADPQIDYTSSDFNSPEDLQNAILAERAYEFVAEPGGNRWLDLIRLERVGEANADRDERELPLIGDPSNKELWFAPIPDTEKDLNPNL